MKIRKMITKVLDFDKINNISATASSISFYAFISVSSIAILFIGILVYANDLFQSLLINDIMKIIGETFEGLLSKALDEVKITGFSAIFIVNIVYAFSSIINRMRLYTDNLYTSYYNSDVRISYIRGVISSIGLFFVLCFVIIFELMFNFYSKYFFNNVIRIDNIIIYRFITMISELLLIFLTITILYIYFPPRKVFFKEVYKTSALVSMSIYLLMYCYKALFDFFMETNHIHYLTYALSTLCYLLFACIYIVLVGIIYFVKGDKKILKEMYI